MPPITLVQGSTLHQLSNKTFAGPSGEYHIAEGTTLVPGNNHVPDIVELAASYLKTPYLWGGRSPFGIDCSGLTQMVFKMLGIKLRRDARQQAEQGHVINLLAEAQAGDLAFFDNDEGNIVHTGILTENGQIIHASGKVRIDPIDHHGIYDKNIGKYTHKLRIIRRMLT
jgi:cell wall-associated NlpC family hydrolase